MTQQARVICIVDDDYIVHFTIKKIIQATIGAEEIMIFEDGEHILEYLTKNQNKAKALPDIIFLDLNMPYMDGWEFMERYADLKPHLAKDINIYILSSSIAESDILAAKANPNVKGYIQKPITKSDIERILK